MVVLGFAVVFVVLLCLFGDLLLVIWVCLSVVLVLLLCFGIRLCCFWFCFYVYGFAEAFSVLLFGLVWFGFLLARPLFVVLSGICCGAFGFALWSDLGFLLPDICFVVLFDIGVCCVLRLFVIECLVLFWFVRLSCSCMVCRVLVLLLVCWDSGLLGIASRFSVRGSVLF